MDLQWNDAALAGRVESYIEDLARVLDHKGRHEPFRHYCTGLLLPGNRKSVEPKVARLAPGWVTAEHQSLLHFVGQSPWPSQGLLAPVRASVLPALTGRGPVEACDDRRWRAVPLGLTALGLPRSRAPTTVEWRQGQTVADIEARGWHYRALARAGRANRAALAPRQAGHGAWLDRSTPGAAADKCCPGRHGQ